MGLEDLEKIAGPDPDKPFKTYLAEQAWRAHCEGQLPLKAGYENAEDLVPLVKDLWTRKLYGGRIREVIWDNPGWIAGNPSKENYSKAVAEAESNVVNFLESLPWYGKRGDGKLQDFFYACPRIAQVAQRENRHQGVVFIDPFDKAEVRWNPVQRASVPLRSSRLTLYLSLPGAWKDAAHRRFRHHPPDHDTGDYPVSGSKLSQMIAPCLVHMLDAYYSALVMEQLAESGVRDFVSLHDCWYLPAVVEKRDARGLITFMKPGAELLGEILDDVTGAWLRGLDVIYDRLSHYLDPPWPAGTVSSGRMRTEQMKREFAPFVRAIKAHWERRVAERRWPRFAFGEAELVRMRRGPGFPKPRA